MDVTSTTSVIKTTSNDIATNPNAQLSSDDFMKLFLTQLQYQDPTQPMDSEKMLEQTSQMTQLQSNNELKKDLQKLVSQMDSSTQYSSISMIGKMVDDGKNKVTVTDAKNSSNIPFDLYFANDYVSATVNIKDKNGDTIKTIDLKNGNKGLQNFSWDQKDNNGQPVNSGEYSIEANYITKDGQNKTAVLGHYPVESVKFENGKASVKIANNYIPLSQVKEVSE